MPGRALLKKAVLLTQREFAAKADPKSKGFKDLQRFLQDPNVHKAKLVWKAVFQAMPPRGVLSRVAKLVNAELPEVCRYYNYTSKKAFLRETLGLQETLSPLPISLKH